MTSWRDLNSITRPFSPRAGREIFNPINAWPDATAQVIVAAYRVGPELMLQAGYDLGTGRTWIRTLPAPGAAWSAWSLPGGDATKTPPVLVSANLVGNKRGVTLHYDLVLDPASVPLLAAYVIKNDGVTKAIASVTISGKDVTVMVSVVLDGVVLLSYTKAAAPIQSLDGGVDAANLVDQPVPQPPPQ